MTESANFPAYARLSSGAKELLRATGRVKRFDDGIIPQVAWLDLWSLPDWGLPHALGCVAMAEAAQLAIPAEQAALETMVLLHDTGEAFQERDQTVIAKSQTRVLVSDLARERSVVAASLSLGEIRLWDCFHVAHGVLEGEAPVGFPWRELQIGILANWFDLHQGREEFEPPMVAWTDQSYEPEKMAKLEPYLNYGVDKARAWLVRQDRLGLDQDIDARCRGVTLELFRWMATFWGLVENKDRLPPGFRQRIYFAEAYSKAHRDDPTIFHGFKNYVRD